MGPYNTWASRLASVNVPAGPGRAPDALDLVSFYAREISIVRTQHVSFTRSTAEGHSGHFYSPAVRVPASRSRNLCGPELS